MVRALSLLPIQGQRPTGVVVNAAGFAQLPVGGPDPPRVSMKHDTDIGPQRATTVMWFRRDLRIGDNPALLEAVDEAGPQGSVVPLFVFDQRLWGPSGATRRALSAGESRGSARADRRAGRPPRRPGRRAVHRRAPVRAPPACTSPRTSDRTGGSATPMSRRRWASWTCRWSGPGRRTPSLRGGCATRATRAYAVFTPFSKAWLEHGWREPPRAPGRVRWDTSLRSRRHDEGDSTARTDPSDRR